MGTRYENLQDLFSKAPPIRAGGVGDKWTYNAPETQAGANFYVQWSNYLSSIPQVFAYFLYLPGWITKALYSISLSLETIYNNLFKLFGFFDYLEKNDTFIGQIFDGLQKLGIVVFVLLLIMFVTANFVTGLARYKDIISHFLLVTAVVGLLPQAIKQFSGFLARDAQTVRTMSDDGKSGFTSLSLKPYEKNVVDLYVVIQNKFDINVLGMDSKGFLNPSETKLNNLSDDNLLQTDFAAWYGGTDQEVLKEFDNNSELKGVGHLLSSVLISNEPDNVRIAEVKPGFWSDLENVFSAVYLRYNVNWIGLIVQQIILIALLISMSIKFVQSVFQVIVAGMIAPIVGYTSVEHSDKFKELLQTIFGTITGIFFEVILLRVAMSILRDFPTILVKGISGLSEDGFSTGLGYWENIMASIIIYAGVYFALTSGNSAVERWLGVSPSQGGGSKLAGMAGAGMAAGAAASRSGMKMAKAAPGVAKKSARGVGTAARKAVGGAKGAARGAGAAVKGIGAGAARTVGGAKGAMEGIKQAGGVGKAAANLGSHAKAGIDSAYDSAKNSVKGTAEGVKNSVKNVGSAARENYNAGRTAVSNTLASGANSKAGTKSEASGVGNAATNANKPNQAKQGIGGASGSQISNNTNNKPSSSSNNGGINKNDSGKK